MAIPEAQLETWSHRGASVGSADTYASVRNALERAGTTYSSIPHSIFLQGSYGNETNIWSESDVDIVINLDQVFWSDLSALPPPQAAAYQAWKTTATYGYDDLKRDVSARLIDQYGAAVAIGDKAISIEGNANRRKSDVIAALAYRRYTRFLSSNDQLYSEGIAFKRSDGIQVVNYPKQHSANMTLKNTSTGGRLKPMVRVFKNLRTNLVERGDVNAVEAPSYFIEGLLYNVPDHAFEGSLSKALVAILLWIQRDAVKNDLVCANREFYLLRDNSPNCWRTDYAERFLTAAVERWATW